LPAWSSANQAEPEFNNLRI